MENSDVAKMLDIDTLAQLIYAQNFSMPAGYVKDSSNKSWLLKEMCIRDSALVLPHSGR